jgi:hypothetical protein
LDKRSRKILLDTLNTNIKPNSHPIKYFHIWNNIDDDNSILINISDYDEYIAPNPEYNFNVETKKNTQEKYVLKYGYKLANDDPRNNITDSVKIYIDNLRENNPIKNIIFKTSEQETSGNGGKRKSKKSKSKKTKRRRTNRRYHKKK